ncbi:MAG TPA: bifunctional methylenetetrahydrofolate dehydrogenase/methenyltetrahydrofolate cyclohydrolase FolD [Burkholderiales bacterium]|jgi:methylenetetrahydrofolate dehydrogenase (NADP+)/methenyltetrahydrofolate cyclohydrolase|nr:bifunctional methylenetetrahydrofolate dehydrogenase/methenyltetrahydrofolate cyclohydrolase FolD [Burkholderiales bacterium]
MAAIVIDGVAIAKLIRTELKQHVQALRTRGIQPGLAVVLLGENQASQLYTRAKVGACRDVGVYSEVHQLPADSDESAALDLIRRLNRDPRIHGILVQLPLPPQLDDGRILEEVSADKDVDGFHVHNMGKLLAGASVYPPCTPYGVVKLLDAAGIPIAGRDAVVVGRSVIVGKPMALMLLERGATVTFCHSQTRDLAAHTQRADILVTAVGRPGLISAAMIKPGAAVIDVGINRLPSGKVAGDVDFESVKTKAAYITPVPGGVGPMTVTMLIANTVHAAERRIASEPAGLHVAP